MSSSGRHKLRSGVEKVEGVTDGKQASNAKAKATSKQGWKQLFGGSAGFEERDQLEAVLLLTRVITIMVI